MPEILLLLLLLTVVDRVVAINDGVLLLLPTACRTAQDLPMAAEIKQK